MHFKDLKLCALSKLIMPKISFNPIQMKMKLGMDILWVEIFLNW